MDLHKSVDGGGEFLSSNREPVPDVTERLDQWKVHKHYHAERKMYDSIFDLIQISVSCRGYVVNTWRAVWDGLVEESTRESTRNR